MSKELNVFCIPTINGLEKVVRYADVEKDLEDFEWLKSKVSIEWFDKLSTDDKIKFTQIMGWEI